MKENIRRIKLYIKESTRAKEIAKRVEILLIQNEFIISENDYDLAISIGGDGTFLKMIHENKFNNNIYYTGINAGSLGFLTDFDENNILELISSIKNNNYHIDEISYIESIIKSDTEITKYNSVNEFVIKKEDMKLLKADIYINNQLLEKFVGDGLLINTSTGSTAYSLSFNGSIIDNNLHIMQLTPIAPINNKIFKSLKSSIIISNDKKIIIDLPSKQDLCFTCDGREIYINNVCQIINYVSNKNIKILNTKYNYFEKINEKIL